MEVLQKFEHFIHLHFHSSAEKRNPNSHFPTSRKSIVLRKCIFFIYSRQLNYNNDELFQNILEGSIRVLPSGVVLDWYCNSEVHCLLHRLLTSVFFITQHQPLWADWAWRGPTQHKSATASDKQHHSSKWHCLL